MIMAWDGVNPGCTVEKRGLISLSGGYRGLGLLRCSRCKEAAAEALGGCPVSGAPSPRPHFPLSSAKEPATLGGGILLLSFLTDCRRGKCLPHIHVLTLKTGSLKKKFFFIVLRFLLGVSLRKMKVDCWSHHG